MIIVLGISEQEYFHWPGIPLEKMREINNEARISKKAKMKKKKKINRNQKRITPWDIHGYKREFHGMNPLRGQLVHPENYNYLNPTQFFDFCCFFLQLISLDCGSIVVAIHDKNFWIIAKLDRKDFVDQFVDILCALENR